MLFTNKMDIMELSSKMEADLLESHSHTSQITFRKPTFNHMFSPRLTRSQTNNCKKFLETTTKEEPNLQVKKNNSKVDDLEKIYLNKKAKVVHKNLETIYEIPLWKKGGAVLLGSGKIKRSIYLDREFRTISKQKSKLRKMKMKRLGKKFQTFKLTDDEFKKKMSTIESYLDENNVSINCNKDNGSDDHIEMNETTNINFNGDVKLQFCQLNGDESKEIIFGDDSLVLE